MLCGIASSIRVQSAHVQTNVFGQQRTCLHALYTFQGMDAYEYAEPAGILSELGKEFWDMLAAKKWSERRDALAKLRTLASAPKLASGDYGDVNRYPYHAPTAMQAHKSCWQACLLLGQVCTCCMMAWSPSDCLACSPHHTTWSNYMPSSLCLWQ